MNIVCGFDETKGNERTLLFQIKISQSPGIAATQSLHCERKQSKPKSAPQEREASVRMNVRSSVKARPGFSTFFSPKSTVL